MIDVLKKMALEKGMALMQSEKVTRILSNEKVGQVVEKAMTVPFKISNAVTIQKERLASLFDLATQEDIDELRRAVIRMEDTLAGMKKTSDSHKSGSKTKETN